jgi:hypothetical protein
LNGTPHDTIVYRPDPSREDMNAGS